MFKVKYKKVWCFDYFVPLFLWRWCVVEEYQGDLMMGGDIAHYDAERVIFKSKNKEKCESLVSKLND